MVKMFTIVLHLVCVTLCLQLHQFVTGHDQCLQHPPNLNPNAGDGTVTQVGALKAYVTGPPKSKLAVVLVSDFFGYEAPNIRKVADKVARTAGFQVVIPDFFNGDPYNPNNTQRTAEMWLKDHGTDKGFEDAKSIIAALKKQGMSKIGAAGFCWGGKVVTLLSQGRYARAAVTLHPARVTLDDIKAVKTPISILAAQFDNGTSPELLNQFKETLSANKVNNFVKIFPGVSHGWTLRYKDDNGTAVQCASDAHQDMLDWFIKYLF